MAEHYTAIPLSPLRKIIAARMADATSTIPHFRLVADFEMDDLLAARAELNEATNDVRISVNDCLIKACASALMAHPAVNSQFVGNTVHQYLDADISIVIAVEGGLAMPVVRAAHRKSVRDIASQVKELTARAAQRQLKMEEITGGSFSLSNLGGYGVDQFDAIINAPQCAILAVGRAKPSLMVAKDGGTRIATVLRVTLSCDHRALDGAIAAAFLSSLRQRIEEPRHWLFTPSEH